MAELPVNKQLDTAGLLPVGLSIPPPTLPAEFPMKVHLVTTGLLLEAFLIPPPKCSARFPMNLQSVTVGLPPLLQRPAPKPAEFSVNVQLITIVLL